LDEKHAGKALPFSSITELYVCAPQDFKEPVKLTNVDEGFPAVMRALAAKGSKRLISCPLIAMPDGADFGVIAGNAEGAHLVRLPTGPCGLPDRSIDEALKNAGITVHYAFDPIRKVVKQ
jgi:hypothetical protein